MVSRTIIEAIRFAVIDNQIFLLKMSLIVDKPNKVVSFKMRKSELKWT